MGIIGSAQKSTRGVLKRGGEGIPCSIDVTVIRRDEVESAGANFLGRGQVQSLNGKYKPSMVTAGRKLEYLPPEEVGTGQKELTKGETKAGNNDDHRAFHPRNFHPLSLPTPPMASLTTNKRAVFAKTSLISSAVKTNPGSLDFHPPPFKPRLKDCVFRCL